MKAHLLIAVFATAAAALGAQQPAAGITIRVQLVSMDTAVKTRDPATPIGDGYSGESVWCIRPEPGQWKRADPACGPELHGVSRAVVAEKRVTTDAQGHAVQRLTWDGGEAVAQIDASDFSTGLSGDKVRLKVAFWPQLAPGQAARTGEDFRAAMPIPVGRLMSVTVMNKRGAMILLVQPEINPSRVGRQTLSP